MVSRLARLLKITLLGVVALGLLVSSGDNLYISPVQKAAAPYRHDLIGWHAKNFLSKWAHRGLRSLPWTSQSEERRRSDLDEYFRLSGEVNRVRSELDRTAAEREGDATTDLVRLEEELDRLLARRSELRNDAEETLESAISAVIVEDGLSTWAGLVFPPTDVRLTNTPKVLVTSPRDRIERIDDMLMGPEISTEEKERIEEELLSGSDLSSLVVDIGGVATYPASIPDNQALRWTLQIAAHEWLHHYLFFRPLGRHMFDSPEMETLNETVANVAGREIGDRAFGLLGGTIEDGMAPGDAVEETDGVDPPPGFDFGIEMRETRRMADGLLAEGRIDEAEAYMEQRRRLFVENGHDIRKLNQAYFAFHGTYADSPFSVSPIGEQLERYRGAFGSVGEFIRSVSAMYSYGRFRAELDELGTGSNLPPEEAERGR